MSLTESHDDTFVNSDYLTDALALNERGEPDFLLLELGGWGAKMHNLCTDFLHLDRAGVIAHGWHHGASTLKIIKT